MPRTEYNVSTPGFVGDWGSIARLPTGAQIDWPAIGDGYRDTAEVVKLAAAALADATELTVDALPVAVPAGTNLYFGQSKEFARVTANAAAGATSLTVEALPSALENDDEAIIGGGGSKVIPAGTVMAALASGLVIPRAAVTGAETAIGILVSSANEGSRSDAKSGYGLLIGGAIYENLLPEAAGSPAVIDSDWKTELQAAGTGFSFHQYSDNTAA
jgi:hypothetical protein